MGKSIDIQELHEQPVFALLSPGFSDGNTWTLMTDLLRSESGDTGLWLSTYELAGGQALRYSGRTEQLNVQLPRISRQRPHVALDERDFEDGVNYIREAIAEGDVYQVNLTLRAFIGAASGAALLARFCKQSIPRFAAWVRLPGGLEFVSASPEMLVEVQARNIRAEPMKGTAPAGQSARLQRSEKDCAELAMITDLLRDDLNHLCVAGTVQVPCARRLIELPYVVQAVSDVTGILNQGVHLRNVLEQLHPGASVTGAPRKAAQLFIASLEKLPRGVYCGTLGLEGSTRTRFALLIRTAQRIHDNMWIYGLGSGITWDSNAAAELHEVRLKLGALGS